MAPQARRGHRRRAVPACVHPRAPPSGEAQAWGPDDIVVETRANIASARGSPKPRGTCDVTVPFGREPKFLRAARRARLVVAKEESPHENHLRFAIPPETQE